MNLFVVSPNPEISAYYLDRTLNNKMITETLQMLSTAIRYNWPCNSRPCSYSRNAANLYLPTHENHPVNIWMRSDYHAMGWSILYTYYLHEAWWQRGYKSHQHSFFYVLETVKNIFRHHVGDPCEFDSPSWFQNSSDYKYDPDVFSAYQRTLVDKWQKRGFKNIDISYFDDINKEEK